MSLLLFLLAACEGRHDGTYLFTFRLSDDSCDSSNPNIGRETEVLGSVYSTTSMIAVDLADLQLQEAEEQLVLAGPDRGDGFRVSLVSGVSYSSASCGRNDETRTLELEGTFTDDLGIEGALTDTTSRVLDDCGPEDVDDACTDRYSVSAMRLDADADRPRDGASWGELPERAYVTLE